MNERMMRLMAADGWDGLNAIGAPQQRDDGRQSRLVEIAGRVFASEEGQVLLAHLVSMTIDRPMLPAVVDSQVAVSAAECVPFVAKREGQNEIVNYLVGLVRQSRLPKGA